MKKFILTTIALFCLAGCEDHYKIAINPPVKKGTIIEKNFIPSKSIPVYYPLGATGTNARTSIKAKTQELYLITIQSKESKQIDGTITYIRSVYNVSPTLFGELEVGIEFDTENNPNVKKADLE